MVPKDEDTHNNQPKDSVGDEGRCYDEMRRQRNAWGGVSLRRMGRQMKRQKIEKIKLIVALGDRWTTNSTQQPTKNMQARQRVTSWMRDLMGT